MTKRKEVTKGLEEVKITPEQLNQIVTIGSSFLRLNKRDVIQIAKYLSAMIFAGYLYFVCKDLYTVLKFNQQLDVLFILSNSLVNFIDNAYNLLIPGGLGITLIKFIQDKTSIK